MVKREGRSRSRRRQPHRERRRRRSPSSSDNDQDGVEEKELYRLDILPFRGQDPFTAYDITFEEESEPVSYVCATPGQQYALRVSNNSKKHIACAVLVDGDNAMLKDGSLIVAPHDHRDLPGYLVSKNFTGKEYVKEYRDFLFGKPKVIENDLSNEAQLAESSFSSYGRIVCEVYEAVLDEEIESDQELRGQASHYRGAGLNGSFEERAVPEGKKKHMLHSAVTVQGNRSSISNSTRGRWWVRGALHHRTVEIRYCEAHSLLLLGVPPKLLGLGSCKDEDVKLEEWEGKKEFKGEKEEQVAFPSNMDGHVDVCDLTAHDDGSEGPPVWTRIATVPRAVPV